MRQFASRKRGDVAVHDALGCFEAKTLGLINFLLPAGEREFPFFFERSETLAGVRSLEGPSGV
ncbi:hypothetical protein SynA1528_01512 [Synechococcus sp. A15-28]|nr:hypothetical protein SynA1528_01512 [Synechococcus sp. A15-28]